MRETSAATWSNLMVRPVVSCAAAQCDLPTTLIAFPPNGDGSLTNRHQPYRTLQSRQVQTKWVRDVSNPTESAVRYT